MSKFKTIDSFFKRKEVDILKSNTPLEFNAETSNPNEHHLKSPRVEDEEHPFESPIAETQEIHFKSSKLNVNEVDVSSIERDPGLRPPMWDYPVNRRDEIRRAYLKDGPNRFILTNYPLSGLENHPRCFQASWFTQFPWLEYSRSKDAAYCLPCYHFTMKRDGRLGWDWLAFQGCPYRSHDETLDSKNRGNFLEKIKILASYNDNVVSVVLENAQKSAKYTSHTIQTEILQVIANTSELTLKNGISDVLSHRCLDIQNIRGQGYNGAALLAASREVSSVHEFFTNLNFVINVASASSKCHDQLQVVHATQIPHMRPIGKLETGKWANQIGTLKRANDSRWGSYFNSICSLIRMFDATCTVLENVGREGGTYSQRGDAKKKSQDILNAIHSVSITKKLIQKLRDDGWDNLHENIVSFSKKAEIDIPDSSARYIEGRGCNKKNHITVEHHDHFDIFNTTIDLQLQELDSRLGEKAMELLTLSSALDPKDAYKAFKIDNICILAEKYYPFDFSEQEKINLRYQLRYFELDMLIDLTLQNLSSIAELCQ
ncbi:uncharacterized protein LOC132168112 [Corylus avellana]|uniref:uncharacterized protein LOC132168112 n=1 Tax=Corylus avellana TaxID=13451 RepID=UPI00286B8722|nr:uncharacterized protein LOC132168112 [Corylus avellana]